MFRSLLLSLALCLSLPFAVESQTANLTYYLCAILQGSNYQSVDQATLVVSGSTSMQVDYNGNNNTAYTVLAVSSGQRQYTNLLTGSSPSTVQISSLAPPGSTGGNDNLFWPGTSPQMLDGNGLTFNFASNISVAGQATQGSQMNLWWASGSNQLDEEVQGGTHETSPLQSTLIISTTQPTCTVPNYAQFTMCVVINGNGYSASLSGYINTTGTPQTVTASSSNGLSSSLQGWTATSISNGQRVYTPTSGSATTTAITGIASAGSVSNNDNLVYPDSTGAGKVDLAGLGFTLASNAPIAGGNANSLALKYASNNYYEQSGSNTETATTSYISFQPYRQGTNVPVCTAVPTTYQFCWSVQGKNNYSSVISGVMTINALAGGTQQKPYWTVLSVIGTRVYTDYTTGATTTSTITGLLPTGSIGGNDNELYIGSTNLFDGDGISVSFNNNPPIFGQTSVNNTMNMWFESSTNTFLEETKGGTHEQYPTSSSFTITAVSTGTTSLPTCSSTGPNAAPHVSSVSTYGTVALLILAALTQLLLA